MYGFFYLDDGQKWQGPVDRKKLAQLILDGLLTIHTEVWDEALDRGGLPPRQPAWRALGYPRAPNTNHPAHGE